MSVRCETTSGARLNRTHLPWTVPPPSPRIDRRSKSSHRLASGASDGWTVMWRATILVEMGPPGGQDPLGVDLAAGSGRSLFPDHRAKQCALPVSPVPPGSGNARTRRPGRAAAGRKPGCSRSGRSTRRCWNSCTPATRPLPRLEHENISRRPTRDFRVSENGCLHPGQVTSTSSRTEVPSASAW